MSTSAQNYKGAIGARLGYPISVSGKFFVKENNAIEAYLGFRNYSSYNWVTGGVAYQIHKPLEIGEIERLSFYYGAGVNVFFWNYDDNFGGDDDVSTSFGIAGYLGLDYAFENSPINLTVDWVPIFFLNGYKDGFRGGYGSFGVRYIFSR